MTDTLLLAIDQGTSGTRAMVFDREGNVAASAARELPQIYPRDGWVEHDPETIWAATVEVCRETVAQVGRDRLAALGITNQRETCLLWDRTTGTPVHNAIVWQDRRGAPLCEALKRRGEAERIREITGLVLDSYFSATKLAWMLDNVPDARRRAEDGELAFGTIDSFLLWRLTGGRVHATDATNAARTMLFDIHTQAWSEDLLALFDVPRGLLPEVRDCAADFGTVDPEHFGAALPVGGIAGDQHAAMIGQGCFAPGSTKATYGTGCFILTNAGGTCPDITNGLLATVAYRLDGKTVYAVEGSAFNAGTALTWLRDELGLIADYRQAETLAASLSGNGGVYVVPAFTGLGAPYWEPDARGAILGLTRDAGRAHIVRAALEASAYQSADLLDAFAAGGVVPSHLRIDGGMATNDWFAGFLADVVGLAVERPRVTETTAHGAALLAGLTCGAYDSLDEIARLWREDRRFAPAMSPHDRARLRLGWDRAVERVRGAAPA